jgi:plasmid stability protein
MTAITVRNLSDEVLTALLARAVTHGRSIEAEILDILQAAVTPDQRLRMGDELAALGRRAGLEEGDLVFSRDKTPAIPISFE